MDVNFLNNSKCRQNYYVICLLLCILLSYLALFKADYFPADFLPYTQIYSGTYDNIAGIEPVFRYIALFFYSINIPYILFAMLICSFCLVIKVSYSRKIIAGTYGGLFLFYYISFYGFLHELTQLRIAIAAAMCYMAVYYYFFKHNNIRTAFWICIAFLFHYSIIFWCLSLFVSSYRRLCIVLISFVFGVSILLGFTSNIAPFLPNEKVVSYLYNLSASVNSDNNIKFLNLNNLSFIVIFFITVYFRRYADLSINASKFLDFVQCSNILAFFLFYFFGGVPVVAYRLAELLRIFYPLAMVLLIYNIKNIFYKKMAIGLYSVVAVLMFIVTFRAVSLGS